MSKKCSAADVHAHADKVGELADQLDSAKLKTLAASLRATADAGDDDDGASDEAPSAPEKSLAAVARGSETDAAEALAQVMALAQVVRDVTGKTKPAEVRGKLLAMQEGKAEAQELHTRISLLETELKESKAREMVRLATKAGKILPDAKSQERFLAMGVKDLTTLSTLIEELPVRVATTATETKATAETTAPLAALSADEEKMIRVAGISRDAFIAAKAKG